METSKNILICPLEWGLGHAGRMIPLAKKLIDLGHNVIIGSGSGHLEFFRKEIPGIKCINFPGFSIRYSSWLPQYLAILFNSPAFIYCVAKEHRQLKRIVEELKIDIVISDSRPGLWNKSIKTVFVTHMIRIPLPRWASFMERTGLFTTKHIIGKFTFCFIPDLGNELNLSGRLSHDIVLPGNARYIGILSRFQVTEAVSESSQSIFCTVLLSGPEPQKSIMKKRLEEILKPIDGRSVILEGKPDTESEKQTVGNITYISHLSTPEMLDLILKSRYIVTRSGYSTLMELASLGKTAVIIPTPGQTEQEYLAEYLSQKGWFRSITQKETDSDMFPAENRFAVPSIFNDQSKKLLDSALAELLEQNHEQALNDESRNESPVNLPGLV